MKRKAYAGLMAIAMGASLVTACGNQPEGTVIEKGAGDSNSAASSKKVTITFWDENAGPNRTPFYQEVIKRFEEKNPNIHVEYVGIPSSSAKQKYDVGISANELPDVGGIHIMWVADFVARGKLLALDKYFDAWQDKDKMTPAAIQEVRDYVQDKKLYQIPNTTSLDILWYRSDWFKQAGLNAPTTWDDFFKGVEKLTDSSQNRYGFSIRGGSGSAHQLKKMMYAYSGISSFFDDNGKSTLNDPKHVEFLKKYLGIYKKYTPESDLTNGYKEMVAAFDTGVAAMIQHNPGSFGEHAKTLKPDQFAAVVPPVSPVNGKIVIEGGNSTGYGIFNTTKHPEEAWKFVSFMNSAEIQSYWNQNIGQLPTNMDVLKDEWVKNTQHIKTTSEAMNASNAVFINPPLYLPGYSTILTQVAEPGIQAVMAGAKNVEQFLNEWAGAMETELKKYNERMKK